MTIKKGVLWVFLIVIALLLIFCGITGRFAELLAIFISPSQLVVNDPGAQIAPGGDTPNTVQDTQS